jgi:CubicO group peptidase (beta-lactamase class C family)
MVLLDRHKISVSDPVAKYLPRFASNGKEKITIEMLLLHRGGLVPDNSMSDYKDGPAAAIDAVMNLKPKWEPGTHFAYSDMGFLVLGKLVEVVSGETLDVFAKREVFEPLKMRETTYNPPASWKNRIPPTSVTKSGEPIAGEVHDPRSHALGGVAGHAGVFSTAPDLARFCRMILNGGKLEGRRILSEETIREMTTPRCMPGGKDCRGYGFDFTSNLSNSPRGERFEAGKTFGHTGYTGTMFWLDPQHDCYFILLTNRVFPDDKTSVSALRRGVATVVAEAFLD